MECDVRKRFGTALSSSSSSSMPLLMEVAPPRALGVGYTRLAAVADDVPAEADVARARFAGGGGTPAASCPAGLPDIALEAAELLPSRALSSSPLLLVPLSERLRLSLPDPLAFPPVSSSSCSCSSSLSSSWSSFPAVLLLLLPTNQPSPRLTRPKRPSGPIVFLLFCLLTSFLAEANVEAVSRALRIPPPVPPPSASFRVCEDGSRIKAGRLNCAKAASRAYGDPAAIVAPVRCPAVPAPLMLLRAGVSAPLPYCSLRDRLAGPASDGVDGASIAIREAYSLIYSLMCDASSQHSHSLTAVPPPAFRPSARPSCAGPFPESLLPTVETHAGSDGSESVRTLLRSSCYATPVCRRCTCFSLLNMNMMIDVWETGEELISVERDWRSASRSGFLMLSPTPSQSARTGCAYHIHLLVLRPRPPVITHRCSTSKARLAWSTRVNRESTSNASLGTQMSDIKSLYRRALRLTKLLEGQRRRRLCAFRTKWAASAPEALSAPEDRPAGPGLTTQMPFSVFALSPFPALLLPSPCALVHVRDMLDRAMRERNDPAKLQNHLLVVDLYLDNIQVDTL